MELTIQHVSRLEAALNVSGSIISYIVALSLIEQPILILLLK